MNNKKTSRDIQIFDLYAQYKSIKSEVDAAITTVIRDSSYINGPDNKAFDAAFAAFCQTKYSIGVGSCSTALDMALEALGITTKDEVICPAHTFAATAEAIVHRGAKPVFVDIDETTYCLDPNLIEAAITKRTKAIIVVHLYGYPAEMKQILRIAKKHGLHVVEDAAQAHGAEYYGKKVGSMGEYGCFSFFPAKNLGCYGDGGAITTNSKALATKVGLLKDHGRISKYEHIEVGYGERLDNLQAAILMAKLPHLPAWNERRRLIAEYYDRELDGLAILPPRPDKNHVPVYYVYTLRHPKRNAIQKALAEKGINTGVYYPKPLHLQTAFAAAGYRQGDLPLTEKVSQEIFSIPVYPELSDSQVSKIAKATKAILEQI